MNTLLDDDDDKNDVPIPALQCIHPAAVFAYLSLLLLLSSSNPLAAIKQETKRKQYIRQSVE